MAIIREHLAHKGLGLHNDLQNESSIVGNFPVVLLLHRFGTPEQKERYIEGMFQGKERIGFGLTEPLHGSDATFMETTAVKQGGDWIINGMKRFNTGMHTATADLIFARTSGKPGDARGISAFITPIKTPGFKVEHMWWTFNTGMHTATADLVFARTSGKPGDARGISAFITPVKTPGFKIEHMWWTFNMPSDHA